LAALGRGVERHVILIVGIVRRRWGQNVEGQDSGRRERERSAADQQARQQESQSA
jgi:hypothetical protein